LAAIGHSTDLSLAELAADARAITPTAAAEKVFPRSDEILAELERLRERLRVLVDRVISLKREALGERAERLFAFGERLLSMGRELADLSERLERAVRDDFRGRRELLSRLGERLVLFSPRSLIDSRKAELDSLANDMRAIPPKLLAPHREALETAMRSLDLVSPLKILSRGYSIASKKDGRIVSDASLLCPGESFFLRFAKGKISASVESAVPGGEDPKKSL
ncbi:MAG: hypothetical protein LBF41_07275, partial [Deltaproteobacteria bacterium]|nr:hypothetical protein [Deltaproteobacteria bacterium]